MESLHKFYILLLLKSGARRKVENLESVIMKEREERESEREKERKNHKKCTGRGCRRSSSPFPAQRQDQLVSTLTLTDVCLTGS